MADITPLTGTYTWSPDGNALPSPVIYNGYVIANDVEIVVGQDEEGVTDIETITMNMTALDFVSDSTNLEVTYTITLLDGTVIEGEYSGETGIYQVSSGRGVGSSKSFVNANTFDGNFPSSISLK